MKSSLLLFTKIIVIIVFTNTTFYSQTTDNNIAFNKFIEEYYEENALFYPLTLTNRGDNRFNDQLPNTISVQFLKKIHDGHRSHSRT